MSLILLIQRKYRKDLVQPFRYFYFTFYSSSFFRFALYVIRRYDAIITIQPKFIAFAAPISRALVIKKTTPQPIATLHVSRTLLAPKAITVSIIAAIDKTVGKKGAITFNIKA